jgi:hypothetical protein
MKKFMVTILILGLLIPVTSGVIINFATAYPSVYLPYITIKSDGNIEPQTEFIQQQGNTYTLTKDISGKYALIIQCSNIVLDGAGYTINGSSVYDGYSNIGLSLENVKNVTIKNISIIGFLGYAGIICSNCSECLIYNTNTTWILDLSDSHFVTVSNCYISDTLGLGVNNQVIQSIIKTLKIDNSSSITNNNITDVLVSKGCYNNTIFGNNFLGQENFIVTSEKNFWDNGSIGNYWSDYSGNGSYFINSNNVDHYPLTNPVDITSIATPRPTSTLTPEDRNSPHLELIDYLLPISIILAVVIVLSVLLYRRHRKTSNLKQ